MTVAARSSGRVFRRAPRGAFATAVRRQSTITASGMERDSRFNVAYRVLRVPELSLHLVTRQRSKFQRVFSLKADYYKIVTVPPSEITLRTVVSTAHMRSASHSPRNESLVLSFCNFLSKG